MEADDLLEQGVLAELRGSPKPELFHDALKRFEDSAAWMEQLDNRMGELQEIDRKGKLDPGFDAALHKVLADAPMIERVSASGVRYSNVATIPPAKLTPPARPVTLQELMQEQRNDLTIVRKQLQQTIEAFRAVIPAADRGEFAALMLSGRAGFADRIQQAVDLIGVYELSYTRGCMTTITATMHAYPAGLSWLKDATRTPLPDK